jgi:hypothetical protein
MGMRLPPELEAQILAIPGVLVNGMPIGQPPTVPSGSPEKPRRKERKKARPVEPGAAIVNGQLVIVLPTETKSEANQGGNQNGGWRGKSKRTKSAKKILWQVMRPNHKLLSPFLERFDAGEIIGVRFTRLGGRELDDDNLQSSMKATRDAVATCFMADDGDRRFQWRYSQEPSKEVGIRIEIC